MITSPTGGNYSGLQEYKNKENVLTSIRTRYFIFILSFWVLFSIYAKANAATLEVRAGAGTVDGSLTPFAIASKTTDAASVSGSYSQAAAVVVFNPARRADLYIGGEYTTSDNATQSFGYTPSGYADMKYSFDLATASFGVRLKPLIFRRWYAYLSLGGIAGQAHYTADFVGQSNIVPLSSNQKTSYFMAAKWGLGVHLNLNREVSVGIEATTALSAPAFDMKVLNTSTGQVENRRLHDNANLSGITLVLCFPFGE